ncbi:hypothetical protein TUM4249_11760 [Shewanella sp. KT0246]|nr:hypothetical protein TUM4249_11760 [Shewanella sp. KT0246]
MKLAAKQLQVILIDLRLSLKNLNKSFTLLRGRNRALNLIKIHNCYYLIASQQDLTVMVQYTAQLFLVDNPETAKAD